MVSFTARGSAAGNPSAASVLCATSTMACGVSTRVPSRSRRRARSTGALSHAGRARSTHFSDRSGCVYVGRVRMLDHATGALFGLILFVSPAVLAGDPVARPENVEHRLYCAGLAVWRVFPGAFPERRSCEGEDVRRRAWRPAQPRRWMDVSG